MRVVVLHNFYRSANASGENLSVVDEVDALRRRGHTVELFSIASDDVLGLSLPRRAAHYHRPLVSVSGRASLARMLREFRPDVALVENLYPFLSPSLIDTLRVSGVPAVAAVRNYRLGCVASTHWRAGRPCYDCWASKVNLPAIRNGCYNDSPFLTAPMALALALHEDRFRSLDHFLPVSRHVAGYLTDLGIPSAKITVRPNFVRDPGPSEGRGAGFVYAGRLSEEKGFDLLLDAWLEADLASVGTKVGTLWIFGTGPLQERLEGLPQSAGVRWRRLVPHEEVVATMRRSAVAVVPSVWNEPFGRVVIEAAAVSRAALVTERGAFPETVVDGETGWVATPTVRGLTAGLREAADCDEAARRGAAARERYLSHYTEDISLQVLESTLTSIALGRAPVTAP